MTNMMNQMPDILTSLQFLYILNIYLNTVNYSVVNANSEVLLTKCTNYFAFNNIFSSNAYADKQIRNVKKITQNNIIVECLHIK